MTKPKLPVHEDLRILAFIAVPDRDLLADARVRRWIESQPVDLQERFRRECENAEHPLFSRIAGVAVGELRVANEMVGLGRVSVVVGSESTVFATVGPDLTRDDTVFAYYTPYRTGSDVLAMRHFAGVSGLLLTDMQELGRRAHNLASAVSSGGRATMVPLDVAVAAVGAGPDRAILAQREIHTAYEAGDQQKLARHLTNAVDLTAYLYCRVAGLEASKYRALAPALVP